MLDKVLKIKKIWFLISGIIELTFPLFYFKHFISFCVKIFLITIMSLVKDFFSTCVSRSISKFLKGETIGT